MNDGVLVKVPCVLLLNNLIVLYADTWSVLFCLFV